jgi:hypothetical protein
MTDEVKDGGAAKAKYQREITYFGVPTRIWCDGVCTKAWGRNGRNYHDDDTMFIDEEMGGVAPDDPGTYEGGHGKMPGSLNKWCVRECERCNMTGYPSALLSARKDTQ